MKAMAFVPAAIAAILALNISAASSQQACGKEYQACMDSCSSRGTKLIQTGCFQGCETRNNFCSEKVYGKRPLNAPAAAAEAKAPARDALAAKHKAQEAPPAEEPAKAPVAEENAPQQPADAQPQPPRADKAPQKAVNRAQGKQSAR